MENQAWKKESVSNMVHVNLQVWAVANVKGTEYSAKAVTTELALLVQYYI